MRDQHQPGTRLGLPAPLSISLSQPAVVPAAEATDEPAQRPAARYVRALLLARIYEGLVAIALIAVWAYGSVSRSLDPD